VLSVNCQLLHIHERLFLGALAARAPQITALFFRIQMTVNAQRLFDRATCAALLRKSSGA
jgi:hypothetical protein